MAAQANIVQVEFFHVDCKNSSFEELELECHDRMADGLEMILRGVEVRQSIKTTVRFFDDETASLTKLVLKTQQLRQREEKLEQKLFKVFKTAGKLRCWVLDVQIRRLARRVLFQREKAREIAAIRLQSALAASRDIAIEKNDHSFRRIHRDEAHELMEVAGRSRSAWVFVFEPNDLLADNNRSIASIA